MRITEGRLRSIIRSVIREASDDSWRDRLPGGRTETWHGDGKHLDLDASRRHDIARSTDKAYNRHGHDGRRGSSKGSWERAESEKFYLENEIDQGDAYAIAQTYFRSPEKEEFCIADFSKVSDDGKDFLRHYFDVNDLDEDYSKKIERSDLEDLCFSPEKLDMDPDEF